MPDGYSNFARRQFFPMKTKIILLTTLFMSLQFIAVSAESTRHHKVRKYELLVDEALKYVGTKYVFGGTAPGGFDCSGFVSYVFQKYNISLPRISSDQAKSGKRVGLRRVQKGDLLFFRGSNIKDRSIGHVGIVVSEKHEPVRFVHASTSRGVVVSELSMEYYKTRFRKARRFKELKKKVKID
ncbi:NlpC/P60 family protein [bacterium]|nr:NlpC/P60 family protein [bacterium]